MESDSKFVDLPPRAKKYLDVAIEVAHLEQTATENPHDAYLYEETIELNRLKLCMLEDDAAEAFVRVAEHDEPESVKHRRKVIESLRDDEDFGTIFTEDDVQAQLASLPDFVDYEPGVRDFVKQYFVKIGEFLVNASTDDHTDTDDLVTITPVAVDAPEDSIDQGETLKPRVTIKVFKDRVIQIGDNGELVSMIRDVEVPKTTEEELFIADARVQALKSITQVSSDDRGVLSNDVWQDYAGFAEYSSNWHAVVIAPLENLTYDGEKIVDIYKPTENAKRRYHRNGAFDVDFVDVDQRSGLDRRDVFEMPSGELVFGKRAKAMHLLLRANEECPLSSKDIEDSDIYTAEEKAELADGVVISSFASQIRPLLEGEDDLVLQSSKREDRSMVYWLEYRGNDRDLYPFLTESRSDEAETPAQPEESEQPEQAEAREAKDDFEASIAESSGIAAWLVSNNERLASHGLPTFDETSEMSLQLHAKNNDVQPLDVGYELRVSLWHIQNIVHDDGAIEELFEKIPKDDPRWSLIDYMLTPIDGQKGVFVADKLPDQFPELDIRVDAQIVDLLSTIGKWRRLSDQEQTTKLKNTYDIFDRIGKSISEVDGRNCEFGAVLKEVDDRITQMNDVNRLSAYELGIFEKAHLLWTRNINGQTQVTQRIKRRAWASSLRSALNNKNA